MKCFVTPCRSIVLASVVMAFSLKAFPQEVDVSNWGATAGGKQVLRYDLTNANGLKASVISYGATLIAVETPDRHGKLANITLHLGSFTEYERGHPLFGSTVGRFANRIGTGGFTIKGKRFDLKTVNPKTGVHIHGGKEGLQKQMWAGKAFKGDNFSAVTLSHTSPDGHEGYPGEVKFKATYKLSNDDSLTIVYESTPNTLTHLNITNHVYWNLNGAESGDVLSHLLTLRADKILALDARKIPTGKLIPVDQTPFDFRQAQTIGKRIASLGNGGYDNCYVINYTRGTPFQTSFARVESAHSGRRMEIFTTEPGVQLYTANYLKPTLRTPAGQPYGPHHGFCLETQGFPDSPNKPHFPSTLVSPGVTLTQKTRFRFSVIDEKLKRK